MMDPSAIQHATGILRFVRDSDPEAMCPSPCSTTIARSWRRCALEYSLDPAHRYEPIIIDAAALQQCRARHGELVRIASAEIDWLYDQITESGYALVLTDASGIVLYEKNDPTLDPTLRSAGLVVGADWSEPRAGTNGIGTCIAENQPVTVHRAEHFRACHIGLSCSGSPIHDPCGALIAVLDASTVNAQEAARDTPTSQVHTSQVRTSLVQTSQVHTMALVNLSAQLIEKCVFLLHFERGTVLRFHARPEFVNLQHDGALALADDGTVIAVDQTASRLLGTIAAALIGRRIDEIFDVHAEELIYPGVATRSTLWPVRDARLGRRFFASLTHGTAGARISSRAQPPPASVLQLAAATVRKSSLTLDELAGEDPQMLRNVRSVRRIADSQVPVMIQGATGAGKEMFARALHAASCRAAKPFVALNCAAIPESLIESELFGYKSGAFTGARREGMKGKILQSSGGTLFLDEIGDMPLVLQTRLLRVLEEQEVMPLGAETPLKVDLRVVCASHQNLRAMISRNLFREDLYYRLNGITLELPPLAQRTDKERLIREFLAAETSDGRPAAIEVDAFQCLLAYRWPGNIRELRNVIRTALAICDGGVVRLKDLPSEVRDAATHSTGMAAAATATLSTAENVSVAALPDRMSQRSPLARAEHEALQQAIRSSDYNMSQAAKLLGVSRNTLYRRCKRLGLPLRRAPVQLT